MGWAVLRVMAGLDGGKRVEYHLGRLGYEYYNPKTVDEWTVKGRKVQRMVQLFPGYLFVKIELQWRTLDGVYGAIGLIQCDGLPQYLDDEIILSIRQDERAGVFLPSKPEKFKRGQTVKIVDDSFLAGRTGIYRGMKGEERCAVLFQMLGKDVIKEISESALEPYESALTYRDGLLRDANDSQRSA